MIRIWNSCEFRYGHPESHGASDRQGCLPYGALANSFQRCYDSGVLNREDRWHLFVNRAPVAFHIWSLIMADKQALIDGLNDDLNMELETVLRMILHSATATGLLGHELRESLKEDLTGEVEHAMFLADKIVSLGGEPNINLKMPVKHKSAKEMLQEDVAAEHKAIAAYSRHIDMAEELGEKGLVIRLEDMLADETEHAEELERLAR